MEYAPENSDIPAFEEALLQKRDFQSAELRRKVDVAHAFFDGYEKCVFDVIDMLHCSNYEKRQAD